MLEPEVRQTLRTGQKIRHDQISRWGLGGRPVGNRQICLKRRKATNMGFGSSPPGKLEAGGHVLTEVAPRSGVALDSSSGAGRPQSPIASCQGHLGARPGGRLPGTRSVLQCQEHSRFINGLSAFISLSAFHCPPFKTQEANLWLFKCYWNPNTTRF